MCGRAGTEEESQGEVRGVNGKSTECSEGGKDGIATEKYANMCGMERAIDGKRGSWAGCGGVKLSVYNGEEKKNKKKRS